MGDAADDDGCGWGRGRRRRRRRRGCGRYGTFGAPPPRGAREVAATTTTTTTTSDGTADARANNTTPGGKMMVYLRAGEGRTAAEGAREVVLGDINAPGMTWVKVVRKPPVPSDVREATWTPASARDDVRDWIRDNKRDAKTGARASGDDCDHDKDIGGGNNSRFHADHGHVPAYLVRMNREREDARRGEEETRAKNIRQAAARGRMSEEEKQSLIAGLRREYNAINASYQKLPFVVDTPSRRARKEAHELKLERIERDIDILSAKHVLLVDV